MVQPDAASSRCSELASLMQLTVWIIWWPFYSNLEKAH